MPTQHQPNAAMKFTAAAVLAVLLLASCCPSPNQQAIAECSKIGGVFTYSCEKFTPWKVSLSVSCKKPACRNPPKKEVPSLKNPQFLEQKND